MVHGIYATYTTHGCFYQFGLSSKEVLGLLLGLPEKPMVPWYGPCYFGCLKRVSKSV